MFANLIKSYLHTDIEYSFASCIWMLLSDPLPIQSTATTAPKLSWGASSSHASRSQGPNNSCQTTLSAVPISRYEVDSSDNAQKRALKEVLLLVLGETGSNQIDHIQLTPQSVVSIIEEKRSRAVKEARNEVGENASKAMIVKLTRYVSTYYSTCVLNVL